MHIPAHPPNYAAKDVEIDDVLVAEARGMAKELAG